MNELYLDFSKCSVVTYTGKLSVNYNYTVVNGESLTPGRVYSVRDLGGLTILIKLTYRCRGQVVWAAGIQHNHQSLQGFRSHLKELLL